MNEIFNANLNQIATATTIAMTVTKLSDTDEHIDLINKTILAGIKEWYTKRGESFDIESDLLNPAATAYSLEAVLNVAKLALISVMANVLER